MSLIRRAGTVNRANAFVRNRGAAFARLHENGRSRLGRAMEKSSSRFGTERPFRWNAEFKGQVSNRPVCLEMRECSPRSSLSG